MAKLAASKIIRAVDTMCKDGKSTVFNDRLQDGRRSFKVWGWSENEYSMAAAALRGAGYDVEQTVTAVRGFGRMKQGGKTRLWVRG